MELIIPLKLAEKAPLEKKLLSWYVFFFYLLPNQFPLVPWKKAMTNLDSILKSRDIILLTKARLDKAMVFPVVMYGCESWTVKKAEH